MIENLGDTQFNDLSEKNLAKLILKYFSSISKNTINNDKSYCSTLFKFLLFLLFVFAFIFNILYQLDYYHCNLFISLFSIKPPSVIMNTVLLGVLSLR